MEAGDSPSSPGFRSMGAACSSPPPEGPQAPHSSSSSAAPDPPAPRPSAPLEIAGLSALDSHEASQQGDLKVEVHLVTQDCVETMEVTFQSSQSVHDMKKYVEKVKGKEVCCAENMVIYHDGSKLSSMTLLGNLDLKKWNDFLITDEVDTTSGLDTIREAMVDEDLMVPIDYSPSETTYEDFGLPIYENDVLQSNQETVEDLTVLIDYLPSETIYEDFGLPIYENDVLQSTQEAQTALTSTAALTTTADTVLPAAAAETAEASPAVADTSAETAINPTEISPAETAFPSAETALTSDTSPAVAENSENLATSICSQVLIGRLLIPWLFKIF